MTSDNPQVGLRMVGGERWIAGVYYIHNLVRALRSLPSGEQLPTTLVYDAACPAEYYREIQDLTELLPLGGGLPEQTAPAPARPLHSIRRALGRSPLVRRAWSKMHPPAPDKRDLVLEKTLLEHGVEVFFPCTNSIGADFAIPWVGWAWDFQHKHYPDFFSLEECRKRDRIFTRLAEDARLLVTSSHDTMRDFDRFVPGYDEKLRILRFRTVPLKEWYEGDVPATKRRYRLPERYLMVPNQFWAHKNHEVAFQALSLLKEECPELTLVCTGKTEDYRRPGHFPALQRFLSEEGLEGRVHILGLIPRGDQITVMRGAAAVLQPSLFEGWSTVVEDARMLGKSILLSDIPVHREQNPPGSIYFDPHGAETLATLIRQVWGDLNAGPQLEEERRALEEQKALIAEYARSFISIMKEAAGGSRPNGVG